MTQWQKAATVGAHLVEKPLKLTQCCLVPICVAADRDHCARNIEGVVKGVDEDETVHGVAKVLG